MSVPAIWRHVSAYLSTSVPGGVALAYRPGPLTALVALAPPVLWFVLVLVSPDALVELVHGHRAVRPHRSHRRGRRHR